MSDAFLVPREPVERFCANLVDFTAGDGGQECLKARAIGERRA
ncbi:hypothetical protein PWG09_12890 [Brevundimonas vesicularis]